MIDRQRLAALEGVDADDLEAEPPTLNASVPVAAPTEPPPKLEHDAREAHQKWIARLCSAKTDGPPPIRVFGNGLMGSATIRGLERRKL